VGLFQSESTSQQQSPRQLHDSPQSTTERVQNTDGIFTPVKKESFDPSMIPVTKDDTTKGPHHYLHDVQDDAKQTIECLDLLAAPIGEHPLQHTVVKLGSADAGKSADRPPLRPPPPSPRQLVITQTAQDELGNETKPALGSVKQAPPGGKPRKPKQLLQEVVPVEGNAPGPLVAKEYTSPRMQDKSDQSLLRSQTKVIFVVASLQEHALSHCSCELLRRIHPCQFLTHFFLIAEIR
jgi:hypothetical protein